MRLEIDPYDRSYILHNIGLIHTSNGKHARALEYYFQALERNSSLPQAFNTLRFPVSYVPSSKMVPVSLSRSGLPRFILKRHRLMMLSGSEASKWIRVYATLFDLHKLILVPVVADVQSILAPTTSLLVTSIGPVTNPAPWLDCLNPSWRRRTTDMVLS